MASELTGGSTVGGERIETTVGAQAKVNIHIADAVKHITASERTDWNGRETTTGSQTKATAAQNAAIAWAKTMGLGEVLSNRTAATAAAATTTGFYYLLGTAGDKPAGVNDGSLFVMAYSTIWITQLFMDWRTNINYTRTMNNGVWGAWLILETTAGAQAKVTTHAGDTSAHLSVADRTKFTGISAGAQPNQNTFANVKVGVTTIAADTTTDTLELMAGNNITLTPDAATDAVTIAVTNSNAFRNVKVGATIMTTDAVVDTLEIVAGANITLTADAATDKLTISSTIPPDEEYETVASVPDDGGPGIFGIVTWYRASNGTKHMESSAYGPDVNGYPCYLDLTYYDAAGTAVLYTDSWVMTYDVHGTPITKTKV